MSGDLDLQLVTAPSAPAAEPATDNPPDSSSKTGETVPTPVANTSARPRRTPARRRTTDAAPITEKPREIDGSVKWREWEQAWQTVSYRLPPELVAELEERLYQLRIGEIGVTVAAAIAHLLDSSDDEVIAFVDRAYAAKPQRRAAPRARG